MTRAYRVLIVSEQGSIREYYVSRAGLRISAISLVVGLGVAVAVGYVLGALGRPWIASAFRFVPRLEGGAGASLARGLASRASLLTGASLQPFHVRHSGCRAEMVLVEGMYCPNVIQRCRAQMDAEGSALHGHRCAEYKRSSFCLSPQKQHLRFCIDRDEHVEAETRLPKSRVTAAEARASCERQGKRLCSNAEWTFACEGEDANPYPYGAVRDGSACNIDRSGLVTAAGELNDLRSPPGSFPRCQSIFGVRDLSGNVEEFVDDGSGQALRKGGYWQPGDNHCRSSLPYSDYEYRGVELGFRCCTDVPPERA